MVKRFADPDIAPSSRRRSARSVAEIHILQRLLDLEAAQQGDGRLQVVALLAGDAQLLALDAGLDLEAAVLDLAHEAPGQLAVDALLQHHRLALRVARRLLGRLEFERAGIDLAPRQMHLQQLVQLAELQLVIGEDEKVALLPRDRGFAVLEVVARADLTREAGEGVVDLGHVKPRDDVETWHGRCVISTPITSTPVIARRSAPPQRRGGRVGQLRRVPDRPRAGRSCSFSRPISASSADLSSRYAVSPIARATAASCWRARSTSGATARRPRSVR